MDLARVCLFEKTALLHVRQAYFECHRGHYCEIVDSKQGLTNGPSDINGLWAYANIPRTPEMPLQDLRLLVSIYFTRDLTSATDVIPAISGVFHKHMRAVESTRHYIGLLSSAPSKSHCVMVGEETYLRQATMTQSFLGALMWMVNCACRRQEYPSWLWTDWHGKEITFIMRQELDPSVWEGYTNP